MVEREDADRTEMTGEAEAAGQDPKDGETVELPEIDITDEELVALCQARVCPGCAEKQDADAERLRSLAEMDNFRKRMQREQEDFRKYAGDRVLADLLPVLDNLDLALAHGSGIDACKDFIMGVEMTRKLFLDTLERHGLTSHGTAGEPFNPEHHEAMGQEPRDDMEEGCVAQVLQRGYRLQDRLLRPAKVMVSKAS